jgi:hypothetical protein
VVIVSQSNDPNNDALLGASGLCGTHPRRAPTWTRRIRQSLSAHQLQSVNPNKFPHSQRKRMKINDLPDPLGVERLHGRVE